MPDEYVTKLELNEALTELERKMTTGFSEIDSKLNKILSSMEIAKLLDREANDKRYITKDEVFQEALSRLNAPAFRQACHPIANEYLESEEGKMRIGCMIDRHLENKRDNASKWINFIKLVGGIIIAALLMYGGQTVINTNLKTQQTVIEALHGLGE